jgi:hypothetical protein
MWSEARRSSVHVFSASADRETPSDCSVRPRGSLLCRPDRLHLHAAYPDCDARLKAHGVHGGSSCASSGSDVGDGDGFADLGETRSIGVTMGPRATVPKGRSERGAAACDRHGSAFLVLSFSSVVRVVRIVDERWWEVVVEREPPLGRRLRRRRLRRRHRLSRCRRRSRLGRRRGRRRFDRFFLERVAEGSLRGRPAVIGGFAKKDPSGVGPL